MSISPSFPTQPANAFFFLCVWCGVRFLLLSWWPRPQNTGVRKKTRQPPHGNLLRALLNKVFKYYPKLKDIHTCLKSSPPLSLCFSLPFSPFLSTVAGVGWFPWWLSVQHNLGHWIFHSGEAEWQLRQEMRYLTRCVMNFANKKSCHVCFNPQKWRLCAQQSVRWLIIHYHTKYVRSLLLKP